MLPKPCSHPHPNLQVVRGRCFDNFTRQLECPSPTPRGLGGLFQLDADFVDEEGGRRSAGSHADGAEASQRGEVELGRGLDVETRQALDLNELGELDGVRRMASADDDDGLAALLLQFEDIRLSVLGGAADGIEDERRRKAGL